MKKTIFAIMISLVLSLRLPQAGACQTGTRAPTSRSTQSRTAITDCYTGITQMGPQGRLRNRFWRDCACPCAERPECQLRFDPNVERFFVHVPEEYSGETTYGLIVFSDADSDSRQLPEGWQAVLDQRKLLYIAPQSAGNDQYSNRRLGLAVLGALEMMKHYRIDPNRVYAAGFSGGARMAGLLGFYPGRCLPRHHPELRRRLLQGCAHAGGNLHGRHRWKPLRTVRRHH